MDGRTRRGRPLARHDATTPARPATSALYSGPTNSSAACRLRGAASRSEQRAAPRPRLFDDFQPSLRPWLILNSFPVSPELTFSDINGLRGICLKFGSFC